MNSIGFPDIFNRTTVNIKTDKEATRQNIAALVASNKGEMFGDPYYGSTLKKLMFDQNDIVLEGLLIDDLCAAIKLFVPQVTVNRKDITIVRKLNGEISATIKYTYKADFTTDTTNLVLAQGEA